MGSIADPRVLTLFGEHEAMQPQLIPMEINLEGFPLFSRQKTPEGKALEVHQSVSTNDGHRLNQLWRVTASHDFSLPGTFDEDVFVGVMALVRRRGGDAERRQDPLFDLRAHQDARQEQARRLLQEGS